MAQEKKKRVVTGKSSTDLVFSAYVRNNEEIFPLILSLYVPIGSEIADVTYGKGVFWKKVNPSDYNLISKQVLIVAIFPTRIALWIVL